MPWTSHGVWTFSVEDKVVVVAQPEFWLARVLKSVAAALQLSH